jgi:hypothetical protein
MTVVVAEDIQCHYFIACWYNNEKFTKYGWVSFWQCHNNFFSSHVCNFMMKPIQLTLLECDMQENQYFHLVMWHFIETLAYELYVKWLNCILLLMFKEFN